MIGIIDYKAGNGPSVLNAMMKLRVPARLVSAPDEIKSSAAIILPGVGSAAATLESLREMGCYELLADLVLDKGRPFFGVCVGLQILFDHSEEGDTPCLGWIPGRVARFPENLVRVPQMGWNKTEFTRPSPLLEGISPAEYFYFVNSYYVIPRDESVILAKTGYGIEFCSMISYKNIMGAQFHLEKSGEAGLRLLKNFALRFGGEEPC